LEISLVAQIGECKSPFRPASQSIVELFAVYLSILFSFSSQPYPDQVGIRSDGRAVEDAKVSWMYAAYDGETLQFMPEDAGEA